MIKICPFCGHQPDLDDPDTIHPATRDKSVWTLNCVICDASILGSDPEDCIERWNKRVNE